MEKIFIAKDFVLKSDSCSQTTKIIRQVNSDIALKWGGKCYTKRY